MRQIKGVAGDWALPVVPKRVHELRGLTNARAVQSANFKIIRRIWRFGDDRGWCSGRLPRVALRGTEAERRTPTAEEARQVQEQLTGQTYFAYQIIRVTGCRGVAVERLTFDAIDRDTGMLKLIGKGRRVRTVPVPGPLLEALLDLPRVHGVRVFQKTILSTLRRRVRRQCEDLGVEPFSLHGLRRLRVREFRRGGVDITVASALLGHSPAVMLKMYDEASEEEKQEAMQALWAKESEGSEKGDDGDRPALRGSTSRSAVTERRQPMRKGEVQE